MLRAGQGVQGALCVGKATVVRFSFQEDAPCTDEPSTGNAFLFAAES